jgi:hypothetical protein
MHQLILKSIRAVDKIVQIAVKNCALFKAHAYMLFALEQVRAV